MTKELIRLMLEIIIETEQFMEQKRAEFLGGSKGRLRELLERIWTDKFKWGKNYTCCRLGMYDDLKGTLEEMGFFVYHEMRYGQMMLCIQWK